MKERVIKAAIRSGSTVFRTDPPGRHHDCIWLMRARGIDVGVIAESEEGFWTNKERFVTREEAWIIANEADQIIRECPGSYGKLYSEHLWRGQLTNPIQNWLAKNADKIEEGLDEFAGVDPTGERAADLRNPDMWESMSKKPITIKDYKAYNGAEFLFFEGLPDGVSASDIHSVHAYALNVEKYDSRIVYEVYEDYNGEYYLGGNVGD